MCLLVIPSAESSRDIAFVASGMCSVSYVYILFVLDEAVECSDAKDGHGPKAGYAGARTQRRPSVTLKLKEDVGVAIERVGH